MAEDPPSRSRLQTPDWDVLIPGLRDYLVPGPTSPEEYAFLESSLEVAIGFSDLFWPRFVEHDGMVFRGDCHRGSSEGSENVRSWLERLGGDRSKTERMVNHEHLVDLFLQRDQNPEPRKVAYLGRILRETWEAKLAKDFPGENFVVELETSPTTSPLNWLITFYKIRPQGARA